jgi:hypothetical protein
VTKALPLRSEAENKDKVYASSNPVLLDSLLLSSDCKLQENSSAGEEEEIPMNSRISHTPKANASKPPGFSFCEAVEASEDMLPDRRSRRPLADDEMVDHSNDCGILPVASCINSCGPENTSMLDLIAARTPKAKAVMPGGFGLYETIEIADRQVAVS